MSTPSDSNSMPANALSSRDSLPSRRRCMAVSALLRAASSRLTVGSLSPLAWAAALTARVNSSTRARMFLSRRSLLTCSWLNRLSGTITASQSPVATRPQKRLTDSGLRCASLSMTRIRLAGYSLSTSPAHWFTRWLGTTSIGLDALPRRFASWERVTPSNVLPAPTTWAMRVPSSLRRARATASFWCGRRATSWAMPGVVR